MVQATPRQLTRRELRAKTKLTQRLLRRMVRKVTERRGPISTETLLRLKRLVTDFINRQLKYARATVLLRQWKHLLTKTALTASLLLALSSSPLMAGTAFEKQDGPFEVATSVDVGSRSKPAFVDIDNDGDLDAFIGTFDGWIKFFKNTGTATAPVFVEQTGVWNAAEGTGNPLDGMYNDINSATGFVDIDGDGDLDLFNGRGDGFISYYKNTGTAAAPTFAEQTGANNPLDGVDVGSNSTPTFVDFDGNGIYDAFIGESTGTIKHYENTGTAAAPVFAEQTGAANPFDGVDVVNDAVPTFVDIDNDSDLDAFIGGDTDDSGPITYYQNDGSENFTEQTGADDPFDGVNGGRFGDYMGQQAAPVFVDIDGDGDQDAFKGAAEGLLTYFENVGSASAPIFNETIAAENPLAATLEMDGYSSAIFMDFDDDGDMDSFVGSYYGDIFYFENNGTASNPEFIVKRGADNPFSGFGYGDYPALATVDIDGDGDQDVFVGNNNGTIYYYQQNSDSSFSVFDNNDASNPFQGVNLYNYTTPTFVDIDNDGDMDAFIGEDDTPGIHFFRNDGTDTVADFADQTGAANPFDGVNFNDNIPTPVFIDIDGDGYQDALVGNEAGTIRYFRNTGDFETLSLTEITGTENPFDGEDVGNSSKPTLVDIDGDGDLDLFTGDEYGYVQFYRNTNNAPTDIALSNSSLLPDQESGTTVGTLSATDADSGDIFTFALASGTGDTDNASFSISGTTLSTATSLAAGEFSVRIQVTDNSSGQYEEAMTISISADEEVVQPPAAPTLLAPADGASVDAPVTIQWTGTTDADGVDLTYQYYVCEDSSFAGCDSFSVVSVFNGFDGSFELNDFNPLVNKAYADSLVAADAEGFNAFGPFALGIMILLGLFGRGVIKDRKKYTLALAGLMLAGLLVSSCASDSSSGDTPADTTTISVELSDLESGKTYYWKTVATDSAGSTSESEVWSFTCN